MFSAARFHRSHSTSHRTQQCSRQRWRVYQYLRYVCSFLMRVRDISNAISFRNIEKYDRIAGPLAGINQHSARVKWAGVLGECASPRVWVCAYMHGCVCIVWSGQRTNCSSAQQARQMECPPVESTVPIQRFILVLLFQIIACKAGTVHVLHSMALCTRIIRIYGDWIVIPYDVADAPVELVYQDNLCLVWHTFIHDCI